MPIVAAVIPFSEYHHIRSTTKSFSKPLRSIVGNMLVNYPKQCRVVGTLIFTVANFSAVVAGVVAASITALSTATSTTTGRFGTFKLAVAFFPAVVAASVISTSEFTTLSTAAS
ncbi:hypothetical protein LAZ67_X002664 [Cordylochernes scorpioides]|uniref:Uncharacterized protein n=1 Tax=Cordylochernes scorpioides TaxID=51811 RepID=A0ABY6LTT5_9ARAC|nr:hypothetical protein LAZ67_X002664 [Cordylochernes scorpioides]